MVLRRRASCARAPLKWHYSTVRSVKTVAVLIKDGAFALSFIPTPGDLTAQESLPPGIYHPRQKTNANAQGLGGSAQEGGWPLLELTDAKQIVCHAVVGNNEVVQITL